jgi:acyl-CoA thioester hydrolase
MPIRWGDMDAYGHVNNTVYFRYMEQARVEWLEQHQDLPVRPGGDGPVIINASCTFLVPMTYPGHGRGAYLRRQHRPLQFSDLRRDAHRR